MINFKTIIVSTSLSLLFGLYSTYGLMLYLEKSEKYYKEQISILKKTIFDIKTKYDENNKKYNDFLIKFEKIKNDNDILSKNITNLKTPKIELINCIEYNTIIEDITDKNEIICNATMNMPNINIEENVSPIVKIDNVNVELDNDHGFEFLENNCCNDEDIIKCRSRGISISEINYWRESAKKIIFG